MNKAQDGAAPRGSDTSELPIGLESRLLSLNTIREAQGFLAKHFAPTRLIAAPFLSQATGKNVYLKLETELPTGSFKVRGAFWALAQSMNRGAIREVRAFSTGQSIPPVSPPPHTPS